MKVVFISPQFDEGIVDESVLDIGEAVEIFMRNTRDWCSVYSDGIAKYYGNWRVYIEKELNLYYQGTVIEFLPSVW